jgi:DNA polymerase III delta subunit
MSNYRNYEQELARLCGIKQLAEMPKMVVLFGPESYFIHAASKSYRGAWHSQSNGDVVHYEAEQVGDGGFELLQCGLFAPATLHCLSFKDQKKLSSAMKFAELSPVGSFFCFEFYKDEIPKSIEAKLKGAHLVRCSPPDRNELSFFVHSLAKRSSLTLENSAVDLIIENVGDDYATLENEVTKLGLIFSEDPKKKITRDMVAPILGILREDHAFRISDLLVENKFQEASILMDELVKRGESSLAILGLLSRHIRLLMQHLPGQAGRSDPTRIRLPGWLKSKYERVSRRYTASRLSQLLEILARADIRLKSTTIDESILLNSVVMELKC